MEEETGTVEGSGYRRMEEETGTVEGSGYSRMKEGCNGGCKRERGVENTETRPREYVTRIFSYFYRLREYLLKITGPCFLF